MTASARRSFIKGRGIAAQPGGIQPSAPYLSQSAAEPPFFDGSILNDPPFWA